MNEPFIRQRGAQLFTTSIDVAEKFGKRHDRVLRSIRNIIAETLPSDAPKNGGVSKVPALKIGGVDFGKQNFRATTYMDDKGEQLARIEEQNRRIEEMLGRVLGVLFPDEQVQEERAFIESLECLTTEEMVAANRQRNKQIKAREAKKAKEKGV